MASSYTENYGLCQWEPGDNFVRTEFNQDNARIDAALKALEDTKAEQVAIDGLTTVVAGKAEQAALDSLSAAVGGKADQTALDSLTTAMAGKAEQAALENLSDTVELKCRMKTGTYTGTGTNYRDSQTIDVGFPIQAVLVENRAGNRSQAVNAATLGGLALKGTSLYNDETLVSISGSSFTVYGGGKNKENLTGGATLSLYVPGEKKRAPPDRTARGSSASCGSSFGENDAQGSPASVTWTSSAVSVHSAVKVSPLNLTVTA